ncbi:MAG: hypothetical protein JJU45_16230 [Acidimicrobiia bacterium]|nr:hypothetical protein [Acidimicrobiia bacterium]
MTSPDGVAAEITVLVRDGLSPRDVVALDAPDNPTLIVANWLSPRSRDLLDERGVGYMDETGNARLAVDRPGLMIRTEGSQRNPTPEPAKGPGLRGPKAWALMRTLVEVQPPYGVSDLATTVDTDPGYVSRLLATLSEELLVSRVPRGPVEQVEWEALLRQVTSSYSLLDSNEPTNWIGSAGPEQFLRDLSATPAGRWAVTGSFAASELVSVAAPGIAIVLADDPERVAALTRLRSVRTGGNVVIARPYDDVVFDRTWSRNGITYASPAQLAVDCLTGPGRMPTEGEALLDWLRARAPQWQAPSLTRSADLP